MKVKVKNKLNQKSVVIDVESIDKLKQQISLYCEDSYYIPSNFHISTKKELKLLRDEIHKRLKNKLTKTYTFKNSDTEVIEYDKTPGEMCKKYNTTSFYKMIKSKKPYSLGWSVIKDENN